MAFTLGVQFKCNASICFGVGTGPHEQFKALQTALNAFASRVGFDPLDVDGFIGDLTVNATRRTAGALGLTIPGTTRETIAANAPEITAQLQHALGGVPAAEPAAPDVEAVVQQTLLACRADRSSTPCVQARQLCTRVRGTPSAKLPGIDELCTPRVPAWVWWTAGAAGALAVVGVGLAARRRRLRQLPSGFQGNRRSHERSTLW